MSRPVSRLLTALLTALVALVALSGDSAADLRGRGKRFVSPGQRRSQQIDVAVRKARRKQRQNVSLRQEIAWRLDAPALAGTRPRVQLRVTDNLWGLIRKRSRNSVRKEVYGSMERELYRSLHEVLPLIEPQRQSEFARYFASDFARTYWQTQRDVVVGEIDRWRGRLGRLKGEMEKLAGSRARMAQQMYRERADSVVEIQSILSSLEMVRRALEVEPVGSVLPINSRLAGKVYDFSGRRNARVLRSRYPDGLRFTDDGFPDFEPYSLVVMSGEVSDSRSRDFRAANRKLYELLTNRRLRVFKSELRADFEHMLGDEIEPFLDELAAGRTPTGYTWHHHQDIEVMSGLSARRNLDFVVDEGGWSRRVLACDYLLVPTDLHRAGRHHGGVAVSKEFRAPPRHYERVVWETEIVDEAP